MYRSGSGYNFRCKTRCQTRDTGNIYNRLKQLEDITNSFKGVDKSFAIQAGREVRIMVVPEQVSDSDMVVRKGYFKTDSKLN